MRLQRRFLKNDTEVNKIETEELEPDVLDALLDAFKEVSVSSQGVLAQRLRLSDSMLKPYLEYCLANNYIECFMPGSMSSQGNKSSDLYYRRVENLGIF